MADLALVVIGFATLTCALALAWLCAKVTNIEQFLTTPVPKDTTVDDALAHLQADHDKATVLAVEAVRLAKNTSAQVDVTAELGHQNAAASRVVAHDLAASIGRADSEESGEPGAAADAGLRSDPIKENDT